MKNKDSPPPKNTVPQPNVTFKGRVMKPKTLNDLRNKTFQNSVVIAKDNKPFDFRIGVDKTVDFGKTLKEKDLNLGFKDTAVVKSFNKTKEIHLDACLRDLEPISENASVNKVYQSTAKAQSVKIFPNSVVKSSVNKNKFSNLSMAKHTKQISTLTTKSNASKVFSYYNSKLAESQAQNKSPENSYLCTKATSNLPPSSAKKKGNKRQSGIVEIEPMFEGLDKAYKASVNKGSPK